MQRTRIEKPYFSVIATLLLLTSIPLFVGCDSIFGPIRRWGVASRNERKVNLREAELKQWQEDFQMTEEEVIRLHDVMQQMVQKSAAQGPLARKIAQAYMDIYRYELAGVYYNKAMGIEQPIEKALPFVDQALQKSRIDPELLYESGLCYANASRDLGWEEIRFKTAVYLFERMKDMKPEDSRPTYQLALLLSQSSEDKQNPPLAMRYVDDILKKNPQDVPSKFLRARILAAQGRFDQAADEYGSIISTIEALKKKGIVKGDLEKNYQYAKAKENLETLDACRSGQGACDL